MSTRGLIFVFGIAAMVLAGYANNLAAMYVSLFSTDQYAEKALGNRDFFLTSPTASAAARGTTTSLSR